MEVNFETAISSMIKGIGETLQIPKSLLQSMCGGLANKYNRSNLKELKYFDELTSSFSIMDFKEYSSLLYIDKEPFDVSVSGILIHHPMDKYTNNLDEVEAFILYHDEIMKKAYIRAFVFFTFSEVFYTIRNVDKSIELPDIKHKIRNDFDIESIFNRLINQLSDSTISSIHNSVLNVGMSPILYNQFWKKVYAYPNNKTNPFMIPVRPNNLFIGTTLIETVYDNFTVYHNMESEFGIELPVYDDNDILNKTTLEE